MPISPVPIIAAILMLLSPKARVTSVGLVVGWVAGILLAVAAGTAIGTAGLNTGSVVGAIAVYALVSACTILAPVIGYLIAAKRFAAPLNALRGWLAKENAVIMAVLLLVIGVDLIGKGIGGF